jgi:hypothetical protein
MIGECAAPGPAYQIDHWAGVTVKTNPVASVGVPLSLFFIVRRWCRSLQAIELVEAERERAEHGTVERQPAAEIGARTPTQ